MMISKNKRLRYGLPVFLFSLYGLSHHMIIIWDACNRGEDRIILNHLFFLISLVVFTELVAPWHRALQISVKKSFQLPLQFLIKINLMIISTRDAQYIEYSMKGQGRMLIAFQSFLG